MPWREVSVMQQRREFVRLATQGERTGASCAVGSGSARRQVTSGSAAGPAIRSFAIARADHIRAQLAAMR